MGTTEDGGDAAGAAAAEGASARLQALFEGHRLTPDPAAHRAQHGAAGRRRAVPVQRRARRTGRGQPAVRHPLRGRPRLRRLPGAAQAPARGRARRAGRRGRRRVQRVPAGRRRPRSRTCGTWPRLLADPAPGARAGPAARRLPPAARPRPARRRLPGVRLRVLRRQGPPGRTAARRGRHDARRPHRRAPSGPGATALLCFALPRHPREVVDALATPGRPG